MLQILVKAVFFIISQIAGLILTPILALISLIIPSFTNSISAVVSWVSTGLTAVPFILKLLCVPLEAVSFYLGFWILVFGISITFRAFLFVLHVYHTFKP